ncbi:uncharacterized protein FIBRA_07061 [Fibroporia radiculosa]|uniref:Zona occludens toxin N-terminal domain-containing protein n=1 Tax=Fibroporia radiculosa TaxID=599839 RepID=J4GDC2_9APHY|nr:uncharacterized protein FIBRA_07061 [Fibroporia radiculosa]CCM04868.1 predicted protein [Fibroporia radiculosa]
MRPSTAVPTVPLMPFDSKSGWRMSSIPSPVSRSGTPADAETPLSSATHALEERQLLSFSDDDQAIDHENRTAPLITCEAYLRADSGSRPSQYGLLGVIRTIHDRKEQETPHENRLYINVNAPLSAIVCGVQGSGKSHTVSVILENMLIPHYRPIGRSETALAGLVLHVGEGGPSSLPNETAWLGRTSHPGVQLPRICVFVSPSSLGTMKKIYAPLGSKIEVKPLLFSEKELDAEAILSMMAVGSSDSAPLYIQTVLSILRELGENFTYARFKTKLDVHKQEFNPAQRAGLKQRMDLLEAFVNREKQQPARFAEGQLTIIDLSDPMVDPAAACTLFEIVTRQFVRADVGVSGKVLVVDEAHKYLSANKGQSGLTKALLSLIRQQRHLGMRVIISTQEPTVVPPVLLDLCGVAILHRFSSPSWWDHLVKHVSADLPEDAFDQIVKLRTGEAIVLAPAGLGLMRTLLAKQASSASGSSPLETQVLPFGRRYLIVKSRQRVTADGGASILTVAG